MLSSLLCCCLHSSHSFHLNLFDLITLTMISLLDLFGVCQYISHYSVEWYADLMNLMDAKGRGRVQIWSVICPKELKKTAKTKWGLLSVWPEFKLDTTWIQLRNLIALVDPSYVILRLGEVSNLWSSSLYLCTFPPFWSYFLYLQYFCHFRIKHNLYFNTCIIGPMGTE
jgi:hypothetical protein